MNLGRLFGGRVRSEMLLALAATPSPQSAYRLAKAAGAQPIQVLSALKELVPLVERGPEGWVLNNAPLREFLLSELAERDRLHRAEKDELLVELGLRPSTTRGRG